MFGRAMAHSTPSTHLPDHFGGCWFALFSALITAVVALLTVLLVLTETDCLSSPPSLSLDLSAGAA